jgi:NAD(P)-dependent dehydrogenase (short-subunit alcohol dehydrogenase family)
MSSDDLSRRGRFTGKTVVVTGGGTGIGKRIAIDLYYEGAYVHILGRRAGKLLEARREATGSTDTSDHSAPLTSSASCAPSASSSSSASSITSYPAPSDGERFFCHEADVSDGRRVEDVFDSIRDLTGLASGLVTSAAINPSRNRITETEIYDWRETLEVNLTGVFNCCKAAVQQMLARGGGSIVNISSVGGLKAFRTRTSYNASKFGVVGLTESIALDYARENIRANAVCPGYVATELTAPLFEKMGEERFGALVGAHAMGRLGRPEEISRAVLFLLSEEASFITGVALPVDGGYLLKG